jgi:RNA polymerase sigma factor (sigma-70 family)
MTEPSEQDWVRNARQGDPEAAAELFRHYWRAARAAAYGVTGNLALAEDAASEALCAALANLNTLREADRFGPWLRTIVVRTARRLKTSSSVSRVGESRAVVDAPDTRLERQEMAASVREAVVRLPQISREAISLFYFEGYSVEEASRFAGVPVGTFKRRLHDGRRRLKASMEQILEGSKPMNEEHERILRQLRDAANAGIDSEAFYQVLRKAMDFGPVPREVAREIWKKRVTSALQEKTPLMTPERQRATREALRRHHEPSERARDPSHPVGAVAQALRAALPEFRFWQVDVSSVDLNRMAEQLAQDRNGAMSYAAPPDFAEVRPDAYVTVSRGFLIRDADGSFLTMGELLQRKTTREAFAAQMKEGGRFSDVLSLVWKRLEPIELRMIEEQLRRLAETVLGSTPVRFTSYQDHHYRSALRMQLGDDSRPAAIGGVWSPSAHLPEGVHVAAVALYLEPWASVRSGQAVELVKGSPFPSLA